MAKSIDISKLSKDELTKLRGEVDRALKKLATVERKAALAAAEKAAKAHGYSLSELTGGASGKAPRKAGLPAKYRNPANPSQTWSGRGRKPGWIKEAETAGKSLDAFLI